MKDSPVADEKISGQVIMPGEEPYHFENDPSACGCSPFILDLLLQNAAPAVTRAWDETKAEFYLNEHDLEERFSFAANAVVQLISSPATRRAGYQLKFRH